MFGWLKKKIADFNKKPFLNVNISILYNGQINIVADFNSYLIDLLDTNYTAIKNEDYSIVLQDQVKVAFFLADQFDAVIGTYNRLSDVQDDDEESPFTELDPLKTPSIKDLPITTQVVDIANKK